VVPQGGLRGFRWGWIPGCCVTNFAPRKAPKLVERGKLTFDERFVLHCVVGPKKEHFEGFSGVHIRQSEHIRQSDFGRESQDQYRILVLAVLYVPSRSTDVRGYICHLNESWVPGFEIRVWSCRSQNLLEGKFAAFEQDPLSFTLMSF